MHLLSPLALAAGINAAGASVGLDLEAKATGDTVLLGRVTITPTRIPTPLYAIHMESPTRPDVFLPVGASKNLVEVVTDAMKLHLMSVVDFSEVDAAIEAQEAAPAIVTDVS